MACSEAWGAENPDPVRAMHAAYYEAGAQVVVTFTLGGTAPQLGHYGIPADQVESLNERLAALTVQARDSVQGSDNGHPLLVSGDIGTTGLFLEPAGDSSMEQIIGIFRQQVRGLLAGGVDLFSIETMMDLGETIAAIRAIRAECDLPVIATMTFDKNGRTLSGNTPLTAGIALAAAGADAVGANCSSGPDTMGELLDGLAEQIPLPIVIKPNAGLPHVEDGNTVFDMDSDTFVSIMTDLATAGTGRILGGCCGTTPAFISALKQSLDALPAPAPLADDAPEWLASPRTACPVPSADALSFTKIESIDTLQDDIRGRYG